MIKLFPCQVADQRLIPTIAVLTVLLSYFYTFLKYIRILSKLVILTHSSYGDLCPQTVFGKIMGGIASLVGVLLLAFPISVVVQNFDEVYHEKFGESQGKKTNTDNKPIVVDGNGEVAYQPRRAGTIWGGYRLRARPKPDQS